MPDIEKIKEIKKLAFDFFEYTIICCCFDKKIEREKLIQKWYILFNKINCLEDDIFNDSSRTRDKEINHET